MVRDGLYLGLARDVCQEAYGPVQRHIVMDPNVPDSTGKTEGFAVMIHSARSAEGWDTLVQAVQEKAAQVGSDLDGIWKTLETGRLEWVTAVSGGHSLKTLLKGGLDNACNATEGDISDAKMIWIYGLCLNLTPELKTAAAAWAKIVQMPQPKSPMMGYRPEFWDPRKDEWRPLDLGAQAAAERGGTTLEDEWNA